MKGTGARGRALLRALAGAREAADDEGYDRLVEEVWAWNGSAASRVHSMEFTAGWETSSGTGR